MRKAIIVVLLSLFLIGQSQAQPGPTLTISAAASFKDALNEIGRSYQKSHPRVGLRFNFGSSGTLQRQIEQGAPVDIFVAAADKNMDELAAQNLIVKDTRRVLAGNRLVLIVPADSRLPVHSFKDAVSPVVRQVAIGGAAVPAGIRAREVFGKLGIWPQVERKAVQSKDVREVLTQVELGNVDAGVVYRTDAAISRRVRVVAVAPANMHKPIRYPVAALHESRSPAVARNFITYLTSPQAKRILRKYQFIVS